MRDLAMSVPLGLSMGVVVATIMSLFEKAEG